MGILGLLSARTAARADILNAERVMSLLWQTEFDVLVDSIIPMPTETKNLV
jgi:hypothetical protein